MKKFFKITMILLAGMALAAACSKTDDSPSNTPTPAPAEKELITITVGAPDDFATKVAYEADGDKLNVTWEDTDKIVILDSEDGSSVFEVSELLEDGQLANFTGPEPGAGPYTIFYASGGKTTLSEVEALDYSVQTQSENGATGHLWFAAKMTGVTTYDDIAFKSDWVDANSNGGTYQQSGALRLRIQKPADISTVKSVTLTAPSDVFPKNNGLSEKTNSITVEFTTAVPADAPHVIAYAMLPWGDVALAAGDYEVALMTEDNDLSIKTKALDASTLESTSLNLINLNKSGFELQPLFAGGTGVDGDPWLIENKRHLKNVNRAMVDDETKFFKMIADVDMTGETWTHLNAGDGYKKLISFDGNNKTISYLKKDLFYVFKGSIKDLTLDHSSITSRGILAEYIQGTGNTITNVTVSNGNVNCTSNNAGGLIGTINSGSGTCATITDCTVSNTNVKGAGVVGGVIGFADQLVLISGCTYTGGTVTATARYAGGLIASTSNYDSVISDCHVEDATITSSSDRCGGFAGLLHTKVQVKGCTVGTSSKKVTFKSTQATATANAGGFAGCNYGKITQNGDVRSKAFVTVTSSNTTTGNSMNIGGFVGYNTGTIEYSDADVTMTGLQGQYIGGFCGILLQSGKISNCTETGAVSGDNYTGGFVGVIDSSNASLINCSSAGTLSAKSSIGGFAGACSKATVSPTFTGNSSSVVVTSSGSNVGGFIGNGVGSFTSNHATGDVASTGGGNCGGFAGTIWETSTGSVFSKNYATGNVSGNANLGGLIGYIGGNLNMSNCYATGNVGNSTKYNQKYGGLVGYTSDNATYITEGVTISNCYATGDVESSFASAGLIGRIGLASTSVSNCAAWNAKVYPHSSGSGNWSSAAVVGVTFPTCTLTDNYRNPSMNLTAYWVPADMTTFQHADVSSSHPLTDSTGEEMTDTACASGQAHYPQYPYHGKVEAGKTLSQLASTTLGWSGDVWNFTGDLPTLK